MNPEDPEDCLAWTRPVTLADDLDNFVDWDGNSNPNIDQPITLSVESQTGLRISDAIPEVDRVAAGALAFAAVVALVLVAVLVDRKYSKSDLLHRWQRNEVTRTPASACAAVDEVLSGALSSGLSAAL
jgi:hypothetical protein